MDYYLADVVREICLRAGLEEHRIDVTELEGDKVEGFLVNNAHAAFTFIQTLSAVFFFDPANHDGKLHFRKRGGAVVMTLDDQEVLEDVEEGDELKRRDNLTIPRAIHLSYHDIDGGLNTDKQSSERSLDTRSVTQSVTSTTVIMTTDQAKRVAAITHKVAIEEQRGEYAFMLPDSYLALTIGDLVEYRGQRLRINEIEIDEGFQSYKASFDRASAYVSQAVGLPPLPATPPRDLDPGVTTLELIDGHIIAGTDDNLGYYLAATGESDAWDGALVEMSMDGGTNYIDEWLVTSSAVIGTLDTPLGAHDPATPDDVNSCQITLVPPNATLTPATLTEMMNRANLALIGDEYLNFGDAEELSPGVWEIGHLLRGRKGTAAVTHAVGERFVLLQRASVAFLPSETYLLGKTLTFRATSLNSTHQITTSLAFTGRSQIERAPAYLSGYRDGAGNVVLSWQGVGRLGGGASVGMGAYFRGYRIDIGGTLIEQQATTLTTAIDAGPTLIRVQQLNAFTGAGPATEITV